MAEDQAVPSLKESITEHLENLLPGMLTALLLLDALPEHGIQEFFTAPALHLLRKDYAAAPIFFAVSYLLGVLSVAIGRFAVDRASEASLRPLLLRRWDREARLSEKTNREINAIYRRCIGEALALSNAEHCKEVIKRRVRARLARSLFIPVLLVVVNIGIRGHWLLALIATPVCLLCMLAIYAYLEFAIYEECRLPIRQDTVQAATL
jgi:hypothetical protein